MSPLSENRNERFWNEFSRLEILKVPEVPKWEKMRSTDADDQRDLSKKIIRTQSIVAIIKFNETI